MGTRGASEHALRPIPMGAITKHEQWFPQYSLTRHLHRATTEASPTSHRRAAPPFREGEDGGVELNEHAVLKSARPHRVIA